MAKRKAVKAVKQSAAEKITAAAAILVCKVINVMLILAGTRGGGKVRRETVQRTDEKLRLYTERAIVKAANTLGIGNVPTIDVMAVIDAAIVYGIGTKQFTRRNGTLCTFAAFQAHERDQKGARVTMAAERDHLAMLEAQATGTLRKAKGSDVAALEGII